ncbi:MAG: hypothetical protein LAO56_16740 [Acidobacteriia bacterium]|nr:hypothetical protein [Terriglobia bacterium]
MAKFKLRKGINVGGLAAETDPLLNKAFVDLGYLPRILDTNDPAFLIVGRTGSGKTAIIKQIMGAASQVSVLDPEELSMQYLHNSVLRTIAAWGVNLDIFYKYLWRHVCILELIRMRYGDATDVPSRIQQIFPITQLFGRDQKKARQVSQEYLREYGEDYWVRTDTRIKKITAEFEEKLTKDAKLSAALAQQVSGSVGADSGSRNLGRVESEVVERAQSIVSDFQISALNSVVETLEKHGFDDPQKSYFIVIDDLDKNWMPDDILYLDLVKSLLSSVHELNRRLRAVKIIVALRENIYYRVFQKAAKHEPQREKWEDVLVRIKWTEEDLDRLVDCRLAQVFKSEYTLDVPTLRALLPQKKTTRAEDGRDYVMSRTFMRPRDVIDFVNRCLAEAADGVTRISWSTLTGAEVGYSEARLKAVIDEWRDSYFGLPSLLPIVRKLGPRFTLREISDDDVYAVLGGDRASSCSWLQDLGVRLLNNNEPAVEIKMEFVKALYLVGLIGIRHPQSHRTAYSFDKAIRTSQDLSESEVEFVVHKMFHSALGLRDMQAALSEDSA